MCIYVAGLQNDLAACKIANSDYREQRNEALYDLELIKEDLIYKNGLNDSSVKKVADFYKKSPYLLKIPYHHKYQ